MDRAPPESSQANQLRALVPFCAAAVAVLAAVADPGSAGDLLLVAVVVGAFAVWAYVPGVPLLALSLAVVVPVVVAQRGGDLEPLMFEVSVLALVVGRWAESLVMAVLLGVLALAAPVVVSLIQEPPRLSVGIWLMGVAFPLVIARAIARQEQLGAQLDATRRQLAEQALLEERREIARDVHDFVGHGLAAVMLQLTSARHVLRRDPAAAEEALRCAEDVGRRSMQELGRTVALLRSEGDGPALTPSSTSSADIATLVADATAGGLAVELRTRGDLAAIAPSVGGALYRIAQEALANAARHAPRARTLLAIEVADGRAVLIAETTGPTIAPKMDQQPTGYGLIGMRERATALGGEFAAGPTPGGWQVTCRLPLEARQAGPVEGAAGR
ncbi:MAG TPA: histidine kinase [Solirubrobacteraceae bacterium]|nr:histidine kinase [Solirubrobacteraceae bacterium]